MVFRLVRRLLLLVCIFAGISPGLPANNVSSSGDSNVLVLRIDGEIEPLLAGYIVREIDGAGSQHAKLILITINTPGGLDTSMREIIQAILRSPVPVAIYVSPSGARAASAGFFILMSADVAAMAPGTNTGAASPVFEMFGQSVQIDDTMKKKVFNDASAFLRSYVSKRGRNVDLANTAVTDAKAFSDKEALDGKLIDLIATSQDDLLNKLDGRTITRFDGSTTQLDLSHPVLIERTMTGREQLLSHIVEPNIAFILLIIGALGLYVEFTHPGMFAPGVIGGIAILLALFAFHLLPVTLTGFVLLALAVALFVLEAKFPTHGILGVGGVVAMVLGALLLIQSPITGMGVRLSTALAVALPCAVVVVILMRAVLRSREWKPSTGKEELLGERGEVIEPLASADGTGMIRVHGELWRAAATKGESIPKGAWVRVRKVNGLTLEVEPANPPQSVTP